VLDARKLSAVLGKLNAEHPPDPEGSAEAVASFVTSAFTAFEGDPRVLDLCAHASLHSRCDERQWISLRDMASARDRDVLLAAAARCRDPEPAPIAELGVWAVTRSIGPTVLIALFADRDEAAASSDDVALLAEVLRLGLEMRRRIDDGHLMSRLAIAPTREERPRRALQQWMARIAAHMRSDGAKIYLCRRTEAGPCIEIISRTDVDPVRHAPYRISHTRGLADWVLLNNDSIVIDDSVAPDRVSETRERCRTGRHGLVEVLGRPGRDQDPGDPTGDRERAFLLVPMREQDRVVGVLSFWRMTDDTYNADMDLVSAERLAERLAPICQWIVATEVRDDVAREVAKLGAMVAGARDPREVYTAVVAGAGSLARAGRALLFLADEHGRLFGSAEWSGGDSSGSQPETPFFSMRGHPALWSDGVPDDVATRIQRDHPGFRVRPHALLLSAGSDVDPPPVGGAVFVMDRTDDRPLPTCDDDLADHEAASFLRQVAPIVLGSHSKVFAAAIGRQLRDASPAVTVDQASPNWASDIAQLIQRKTAADAVLIYQRERGELRITGASTEAQALRGLSLTRDSLTERCISTGRNVLIPDTDDRSYPEVANLRRDSMHETAVRLGWRGIRSWYCQPVVVSRLSLGAIKLLTRSGGRFLDPTCIDVVTAVAAHIEREMARHTWTDVLDGLNKLAANLSGKEGRALADDMVGELEAWAHRFIQEDCRLVLIASVYTPRASVFAASKPIDVRAFEEANSQQLDALSVSPIAERLPTFILPDAFRRADQIAVRITLASNPLLRGCVLMIAEQPAGQQAWSAAAEAAREIALLLDYEQRTRLRIEQGARFRHALLGPVQGLMNQAGALNRLVKRGPAEPEKLREIAARVKSEANAIGLWRDIQRLYATTEVRVVPRTQALRPIVERCVERFREPLRVERSCALEIDFRSAGSLDIPIDEPAIDLVLTNLLDNARKYSFAHTTVKVTVESLRSVVRVTVEDVGHGIPPRLQERIYQVGERLDWEDRVRSIDGTGLGLPISRKIVVAHGGRLYHECDEGISVSDSNRCRVRFIIELPNRWRP
jgi:signal transduction histidine kinase